MGQETVQLTRSNLTPSQAAGVDKVEAFLLNNKQRVFRIIGPAGYGKTTMIKFALKKYLDKDEAEKGQGLLPNVLGSALTHKAKSVLGKHIMHTTSFASAYGYREKIDDKGVRKFEPLTYYVEPPLGHSPISVFVFDEISMWTQKMIDIMLTETPPGSKIILMGDMAQLPPVYDESDNIPPDQDSPVFYMKLDDSCHHELTEPVRQKAGSPILELAFIIRKEIEGGQDLNKVIASIFEIAERNGNNGIRVVDKQQGIAEYIGLNDFLNNKIITYRKEKVNEFNTDIRNTVMNYPKETLVDNDIIFLTNNFRVELSETLKFVLYNADEYIINKANVSMVKVEGYEIESYFAFVPNPKYNFPVYITHPTAKGLKVYNAALKELSEKAKEKKFYWKKFYNVKDSITEYTMAYAINAYRCQGSTYDNVYFNLLDVLELHEWGILTTKRALQTIYTVVTRAKDAVIFIR